MTCATPVLSACNPCQSCCSVVAHKRGPERVPVLIGWAYREELAQEGGWILKSVSHVVKSAAGASLSIMAYDPTKSYASGTDVSVGAKIYRANTTVNVGGDAPYKVGQTVWDLQSGLTPHLYIPVDPDSLPMQWIDRKNITTTVLLEGGADDTDYRVESTAVFRNCEGTATISLWDCALVKVLNCGS